jgi:AcrR family transcriptional regulator
MRRTPRQERGKQKVESILEAAREVFLEVGIEAATTIQIAERAGTSIGSLYQFFPNKEAIVRVMAERHAERANAMLAEMLNPELPFLSLDEVLDAILPPLKEFYVQNRDFIVIFSAPVSASIFNEVIAGVDNQLIAMNDAMSAIRAPEMPAHERHRISVITHQIIKSLMALPTFGDEVTYDEVLADLRVILTGYLGAFFGTGRL